MNRDFLDYKIERILKHPANSLPDGYIFALCDTFYKTQLYGYWHLYWNQINHKNKHLMTDYFSKRYVSIFEHTMLRLLVLEDFKKYLREQFKE